MNVEVLATAFNMDKAEFMGHVILVDGFGNLDTARLNELFYDDPAYEEIGSSDLDNLNLIPAVIVDKNWFMVYDQMMQFTENYNGKGLYWNYFLHTWKVMSVSPFANAAVFTTGTPAVASVAVSPSTATVAKGGSVQLTATVQTTNFAPQRVTWSSANAKATVDSRGFVTIASDFSGSSVVITATSTFDPSKKGTATITVQ